MTNFKKLLIVLLITISFSANIFANWILVTWDSYLERQNFTDFQKQKPLTMKWLFTFYFNELGDGIPESYKYIELKFLNIGKETVIYDALQKWVYLDLINNKTIDLKLSNLATEDFFAKLVNNNFEVEVKYTKWKIVTLDLFLSVMEQLKNINNSSENSQNIQITAQPNYEIETAPNFPILNDVYSKLKNQHYDSEKFTASWLIDWAIKWMSETTWDKHTTYFPPVESKDFNDQLSWEFEWIWAHVDMEKPWILKIVAPMSWSPAEKFWLKSWDQIIKIDNYEIGSWTTLEEAVWKIKWPSWTDVSLTFIRDWQTMNLKITRAKINMDFVEYTKLDNGDNYIRISIFWEWVAKDFSWAINKVITNEWAGKTIIDLRNNPWWSLDEVATMLEYFVPKWQPLVNIKYKRYSSDMNATWLIPVVFKDKKVVILINKWSASASEIMAGTIKDYLWDNVKIIGETSYGKWSVQSLDGYLDGSSFKYTIAKWFTGKTKVWIDGIGIKPDIELKLDENRVQDWIDNQLDYAKNYRF